MTRALFSLAASLLLAASLSLKVEAFQIADAELPSDRSPDIARFLLARGFSVAQPAPNTAPEWVTGTKGQCQVRIADVSPQGWYRSIIAEQAANQRLTYSFDGALYSEQPVLRTRLADYRARLFSYFSMLPKPAIVRAIIVAPNCGPHEFLLHEAESLSK